MPVAGEDFTFRSITDEEFAHFFTVGERAFGTQISQQDVERERGVFELDRTTGIFSGDTLVGTGGIFSLEMSVPGSLAPVAGVTFVTVSPTHRRRGLLTELMRRQLQGLHEAGREPVAALWASESAIYRRFGYGTASCFHEIRIDREGCAFDPLVVKNLPSLDYRLEPARDVVDELARIHDAGLVVRPGDFRRDERWWTYRLSQGESRPGSGWTAPLAVLATIPGSDVGRGYALYRTKAAFTDLLPTGEVEILEIVGDSAEVRLALWRQVLDLDLMHSWRAWVAVDDPLHVALADPRRARPRLSDNLWVRVVDVGRALTARRYALDIDMVLSVHDDFCPWNTGHWHLIGGPDGAECRRTEKAADIELPAWALGAVYLGSGSLYALARAGNVVERSKGALARAAAAFTWPVAAFCPMVF